jgi:hypothetical protein
MPNLALTGPAAAAHFGLDGFRDAPWPDLWCGPSPGRNAADRIRIRTSAWRDPVLIGDLSVAHPLLVLRHLGEYEAHMDAAGDGLTALERVEFAVEHALREGHVGLSDLRVAAHHGRTRGDQLLREVLALRGDEPAAESYAEVKAIQLLRSWGIRCWRQVPVYERGRLKHRADLLIAFDECAERPLVVRPSVGMVLEVDSREFHEGRFEEDHRRQTTYDALGIAWISFTPTQFNKSPERVRTAIERRLASARRAQAAILRTQASKTGRR